MAIFDATRDGDNLASRFPEAMLALLDQVFPDGGPAPLYELRSILDMIATSGPMLRQDERWLRLDILVG